ncbi:MAG TPA: RNA methyltransferase [Myxococcaceae bacterium]|jgi:tRNA (guanosine-2'-O-)-methyltransferase
MAGGGPKYEPLERTAPPEPGELVVEDRLRRIDEVVSKRTRTLAVVLDQLEDAFNMAAVLRTCEAMGVQDVHVVRNPEVPFQPNSTVTQGCDKWLDIHRHETFGDCRAALKAAGFSIWVSAIREGATSLFEMSFDGKLALVFGNERHGVSPEIQSQADGVFWIPMRGFTQSLNISVAAAAAITHAVSWRLERRGPAGDLTPDEARDITRKFQVLSVKQRKKLYREQ